MLNNKNWEPKKTWWDRVSSFLSPPDDISLEDWQKLLLTTHKLIQNKGWITGGLYKTGRGYCIIGALQKSAFGKCVASNKAEPFDEEARKIYDLNRGDVKIYNEALGRLNASMVPGKCGTRTPNIISWNDYFAKSKETVLNKLKEVANAE